MFYIVSRLFTFFITPAGIITVALSYAFFTKNHKKARKVVGATLVFFYIFSNPFFVNEMLLAWEVPPTPISQLKNHDVGIILTGGITNDDKFPKENIFLYYSADRVGQAVQLFHAGKIKKILISGGSANVFTKLYKQEAHEVAQYLIRSGVPAKSIFIEGFSVNTRENALFSSKILKKQFPNQSYLLITSAFHLRRARSCFDKVGVKTTVFGSNYYSHERQIIFSEFVPKEQWLNISYWLFREWVGFLTYKIVGYI